MPRQTEKAFVPKQVVREKRDRKNVPGISDAPGGKRQNPNAIPRMQNGTEHEHRAERPERSAFPVANEQKRNKNYRDNDDRQIMKAALVRIRPNGLFDEPPKEIVQTRDVVDLA